MANEKKTAIHLKIIQYWNNIEKTTILIGLIVFFLMEVLAIFFPIINTFFDAKSYLFIAFFLLFIYKILTEINSKCSVQNFRFVPTLDLAMHQIFEEEEKITSIDIFCYSGSRYSSYTHDLLGKNPHLHNSGKLRVLLLDPESFQLFLGVDKQSEIQNMKNTQQGNIDHFNEIMEKKFINDVEVKYYSFIPQIHFIIVNNKVAVMGILKPRTGSLNLIDESTSYFVISANCPGEAAMIEELMVFFERLFKDPKAFSQVLVKKAGDAGIIPPSPSPQSVAPSPGPQPEPGQARPLR